MEQMAVYLFPKRSKLFLLQKFPKYLPGASHGANCVIVDDRQDPCLYGPPGRGIESNPTSEVNVRIGRTEKHTGGHLPMTSGVRRGDVQTGT